MLNGVDLSIDQGDIDFHALKASGEVDWVHAKASEGITYTDVNFPGYHNQAKIVGMPFGGYHFFHAKDDGIAQANNFLNRASGFEGQVVPMIDVEQDSVDGQSADTLIGQLVRCVRAIDTTLAGKLSLIYFEYSLWTDFLKGYDGLAGHPAWPAAYNTDETLDMTGTGWKVWTVWQYSDGSGLAPIPGISTAVDRDRLNASDLSPILR